MTEPPSPGPPGLLLVCALRTEQRALRAARGTLRLLRTGMGPRAAEAATRAALRPTDGRTAVLVTGFCAGLAPGLAPGDVVVATELCPWTGTTGARAGVEGAVLDTEGAVPCPRAAPLAGIVAEVLSRSSPAAGAGGAVPGPRAGTRGTVHTGLLAGADHVVRGRERAELRAAGALAVDMESAAVVRAALATGPRPVAAVRVVVDTPDHELLRPGTLRSGLVAYRTLRALVPAFTAWRDTLADARRDPIHPINPTASSALPGGEPNGHAAASDHPCRDLPL
ncbi:phosphorylase family protein [Wenjunlia vitaminophila]|uniref:phosphorylase family protein n=1 Tax=Wenjunlia vitaminophila TaxID=76728 RepID=UPI000380A68E|nr:hypothetical protein [Wenjunlia vitaminophila]